MSEPLSIEEQARRYRKLRDYILHSDFEFQSKVICGMSEENDHQNWLVQLWIPAPAVHNKFGGYEEFPDGQPSGPEAFEAWMTRK